MLSVTTSPQGLISFLVMLLNTGTQLTWHCEHRDKEEVKRKEGTCRPWQNAE